MAPKEKLCIALDVDTYEEAKKIVSELKDCAGMFKVNSLFIKEGPNAIDMIKSLGCKTFLDLKFHDIPNTAANYAREAVRADVDMFTIHASGGFEMMKAVRDAAEDEAKKLGKKRPVILAVTILTSIDSKALSRDLLIEESVEDAVEHLAKLALSAGVDGVVASPRETKMLRDECGKDFFILTPGIRLKESAKKGKTDDQKRVMGPKEAIEAGASMIVVGRPIVMAANRKAAAKKFLDEME